MKRAAVTRRASLSGALIAVGGAVVISTAGYSGVYASQLAVHNTTKTFVVTTASQPNIPGCVTSIEKAETSGSGKDLVSVAKVKFDRPNTCIGVTITVTVVDSTGKTSTGSLTPLPVDRKDEATVPVTGTASQSKKPQVFVAIT